MSEREQVIIFGGVAGGASCAVRLRRLDENASNRIGSRNLNEKIVSRVCEKEAVCPSSWS